MFEMSAGGHLPFRAATWRSSPFAVVRILIHSQSGNSRQVLSQIRFGGVAFCNTTE